MTWVVDSLAHPFDALSIYASSKGSKMRGEKKEIKILISFTSYLDHKNENLSTFRTSIVNHSISLIG
jgi:hypothetical protein